MVARNVNTVGVRPGSDRIFSFFPRPALFPLRFHKLYQLIVALLAPTGLQKQDLHVISCHLNPFCANKSAFNLVDFSMWNGSASSLWPQHQAVASPVALSQLFMVSPWNDATRCRVMPQLWGRSKRYSGTLWELGPHCQQKVKLVESPGNYIHIIHSLCPFEFSSLL